MSWYSSREVGHTSEDWNNFGLDNTYGDASPQVLEQFEEAKKLAKQLIESSVVGDPHKVYRVSLSGHANKGHVPHNGFANDTVTVSVTQVS